jgi:hypothetical protein
VKFTGTDPQSDAITYEVQIDTTATFNSVSGSPLIDALSASNAGFADITTPAHTDPFTSGEQIGYTVQSALTNNTTYYWRVRGKDPSGSNTWGSWSSTQTFYVDTSPSSVGQLVNLNYWYVSEPTPSSPTDVYEPTLDALNDQYVYVNDANKSVVFYTPLDGSTTSGSTYPRTELRELLQDGTGGMASWSITSGWHVLEYDVAIDMIPTLASHQKTVFGQIHDSSADVIELMALINTDNEISCRLNGTTQTSAITSYTLGTFFHVRLEVSNSTVYIYYNDTLAYTFTGLTNTGCYFKAGCYAQANSTDAGWVAGDYSQAQIKNLTVMHSANAAQSFAIW